ncbi:MAG TPA: diguanylate cyclase, partial [Polyangiaceae bacterium]
MDDEPQVLVALEDLLSDEFLVLKSESAERALRLVEQEPDIAVVLSDQRMPAMQGDQLFKALRSRFNAERILATGFADLTAVIRAVNDGQIFAYVTKPWDPEDLRAKVHLAADHFRLTRELAHERKLLEDLMHSMPDAIYFKDTELRFERVNGGLVSVLNKLDQGEVVGRRLSEIWPNVPQSLEAEATEWEVLRSNTPMRDSLSSFIVAGERRWFSSTKAPVRNHAGRPVGLVGIARDVTSRVQMEQALKNREEQLRLTFLASQAGLFDWNLLTGRVEHSPSMATMLAGDAGDAGGVLDRESLEARVHADDVAHLRGALHQHFAGRAPLRALQLRAKVGEEYRWFEINAQAVWDAAGIPTRLVGSSIDITERKLQEARISRLTRTYAVLSGITGSILRVHDRAALLAESCNIAVAVGELALAVVAGPSKGSGRRVVVGSGGSPRLVDAVADWLTSESEKSGSVVELSIAARRPLVFNDLRQDKQTGELRPALLSTGHLALAVLPVLVSGEVDCLFALFADHVGFFDQDQVKLLAEIADNVGFALEHSAQAERLDFLAYYDDLTGLANRRLLTDRLAQQLAVCSESKSKLAVVLVDLERFRHVNETLGRRSGDELLIEIAGRMGAVADGKWAIARFASNTFAVVLGPLEHESEVAQWIEQALASLGQSATVSGTELRLAARAGISMFPADGQDADALIANAEAALKKAKDSAQRYLFYTSAMNGRVAERLSLETRLRNAIELQEFLLHYQPKVELKTGRVVGLEALIRWREKDGKLIPPGLFIPLLEETGMIIEVGKWVIEQAARQHADWSARGLNPPRIAVNVSPLQLGQPDFVPS